MQLEAVEFHFETHCVIFKGSLVIALRRQGDKWDVLGQMENRWTSKADDDGHVMGRFWKPRLTDALDCLRQISHPKPEPKKPRPSRPLKIHEPVD